MKRSQAGQDQKRESPIQFRPGSELGHLVSGFAVEHRLQLPEACRLLIALAVTEMDRRHYGLIDQLAKVMGGENAFNRACLHVHTALEGARRATNTPMQLDPERSLFIEKTVSDYLAGRGLQGQEARLWFLPKREPEQKESSEMAATPSSSLPKEYDRAKKKKRTIRPINEDDLDSKETSAKKR